MSRITEYVKLTRSEIYHRYRLRHPEQVRERNRQWKAEHYDQVRAYNKEYKAKLSKEKRAEYHRNYRLAHLEKLRASSRAYQAAHKEERRIYDKTIWHPKRKLWNRKRRLCTTLNGKSLTIQGVLKRTYPNDSKCELCHGVKNRLAYHHWEDTEELLKRTFSDKEPVFLKGLWVCQPCNNFIHRLTQFPDLAKTWFELKEKIERPQEDQTYGI